MQPEPVSVATGLVIYISSTLLIPLAIAILPPSEGAWWILKTFGGFLALMFVGTFLSRSVYYSNLLGSAYSAYIVIIVTYTTALFFTTSITGFIFYGVAACFHFGLIPSVTSHIARQRTEHDPPENGDNEPLKTHSQELKGSPDAVQVTPNIENDVAEEVFLQHYMELALGGYADAQCKLAGFYMEGSRVAKDEHEAFKWYQRAAEQGHPEALFAIAVNYERGRGVTRNEGKAVSYYERAAAKGIHRPSS
jgi:hypothetical protein